MIHRELIGDRPIVKSGQTRHVAEVLSNRFGDFAYTLCGLYLPNPIILVGEARFQQFGTIEYASGATWDLPECIPHLCKRCQYKLHLQPRGEGS